MGRTPDPSWQMLRRIVLTLMVGTLPGAAHSLSLGPITPTAVLYGVSVKPTISADIQITTTEFSGHLQADVYASLDTPTLSADLQAITTKALPFSTTSDRCTLEISSVQITELLVTHYTGSVSVIADVQVSGCPLTSARIPVSIHFVPSITANKLMLRIESATVKVPFEWRFVGAIGGKNVKAAVESSIRSKSPVEVFKVPSMESARVALQGASLDQKNGTMFLHVRFDALVDRGAIQKYIAALPALHGVVFRYPSR